MQNNLDLDIVYKETIQNMYQNRLYVNYLFYACMIGKCNVIFTPGDSAIASVSWTGMGYNLHLNLSKLRDFNIPGRLAILKHEMLHILNGHLLNRLNNESNHQVKNLAFDCAINQLIDKNDLPECGILPSSFEKYGLNLELNRESEYYYHELMKIEDQLQDEDSIDEHSEWSNNPNSGHSDDFQKIFTKKMIEESKDTVMKTQGAGIGSVPSEYGKYMDIFTIQTELDWKKHLKNIVGNERIGKMKSFYKVNRRSPERKELKGNTRDRKFNLLWVADVSGSVDNESFCKMSAEILNITKIFGTDITLVQVDTEAREPEKLTSKTTTFKRKGTGGTYISNALKKVNVKQYDAIMITTDGELSTEDINTFLETRKKLIWVIEKNGTVMNEMETRNSKVFKLKN